MLRVLLLAMGCLKAYGVRSFFTVLSVALGVCGVTITQAVTEGADARLEQFVEWFGADSVFVTGGALFAQAVGARAATLTRADEDSVRLQIPGVWLVTAGKNIRNVRLSNGAASYETQVLVGSSPPFATAWSWNVVEGDDLSEADSISFRKYCLLGHTVSRELFGQESPVGRTIRIAGHVFTVKGLLQERGFSSAQASMDDRVVIPLSTLERFFHLDRKYVNGLRVRFVDAESLESQSDNLRALLRDRHGLREGDPDDFTIVSSDEIISFLSILKRGVGLFLAGVSCVTLAVGGMVLANLSYVAIDQRKREIGILMAVGATHGDIVFQFFAEIMMLCLLGAVVGLAMGSAATVWINAWQTLAVSHSPTVWLAGLAGAVSVALAFGIAPALAAARLDPVTSLSEG